jgi:hypothetical protein
LILLKIKKEVQTNPHKELLDFDLVIPSHILRDRKLSALEAIIEYLKEVRKLNYREISTILNRDERNIWTIYNRAKKKRGNG